MLAVMRYFGFDENFVRWVALLYRDIGSKIYVNRFFTEWFSVTRSVRQGCSLSPGIYTLVIEVLAHKIRTNMLHKGIFIAGCSEQIRLLAHADDTTCFATDLNSFKLLLETYEEYSLFSGSRLNKKKCAIMALSDENIPDER
jgi:hypothetical protein